MAKDIPLDSISRLRDAVPKLNAASDRSVKIVNQVELLLNDELSVGIPADVTVQAEECPDMGCAHFMSLAYRRHNGRFRIVVVTGFDDDPDSWEMTPFSECDRDTKSTAIEKLGSLINAVTEAVEERVEKISDIHDELDQTISAINA